MNPPAKPYRLGLVVGKFSPLHLGHEYLIEQARQQCEQVLLLSYSQPEFPDCEPARRARWLADRFPDARLSVVDDALVRELCAQRGMPWQPMPANDAPDALQQAYFTWLVLGPIGARPDAMLGSEPYVALCAEQLSAALGMPVTGMCVDQARQHVPISGSRIREDVHAHRHFMRPQVYQDFVRTVVLLGGESTGKTTLAQALAQRYGTTWVPEYGRSLWVQQGGILSLDDLVLIGRTQLEHEAQARLQAHRYLFCDTSPLTTLGYAGWMFQCQPEALCQMARQPYDLTVLCEPDTPFEQDGTRQAEAFRHEQHQWYVQALQDAGISFLSVRGTLEQRMEAIQARMNLVGAQSS
jgi:HTH-type transcriptional repressor of NAD biosynthesis genes